MRKDERYSGAKLIQTHCAVLAQGGALPLWASLRCMFALDEAPHLIELHLGHGQVLRRCALISSALCAARWSRVGPVSSVTVRAQGMPVRSTWTKSILRAITPTFRGRRSKKTVSAFGTEGDAFGALEDASLPTLRQIGRDRRDVAAVYHLSRRASGIRARLVPALGVRMVNPPVSEISITHLTRGWATFLFQSTSG